MADGRFLSKSIAHDIELNSVSLVADHLFVRCIPHLDVEGRMLGNPAQVKSIAVPMRDDVTVDMVAGALEELSVVGLVRIYESDSKTFIQFPGFARHQKGLRKNREAPSKIPPPEPSQTYSGPTPESSGLTPELVPDQPKPLRENNSGVTPEDSGVNRVKVKCEGEVEGKELLHTTRTRAREGIVNLEDMTGDERLRTWLGRHGHVVAGLPLLAAKGIGGAYCPHGTAETIWGTVPEDRRPALLADACLRWSSEGHPTFNAKFFRRILESVIGDGTAKATGTDAPPRRPIPAGQGAL